MKEAPRLPAPDSGRHFRIAALLAESRSRVPIFHRQVAKGAKKATEPKDKSLESWIWDAACGSGGLLVKCEIAMEEKVRSAGNPARKSKGKGGQDCPPSSVAPLKLFGQEFTPETWAMANMNMIIHDMEGQIEIGDTFKNPKFRSKAGKLGMKNWMFIGGEHSGWRSAVVYTFVEQIRRHGHDPHAYFEWVFGKLMHDPGPDELPSLLLAAWIKAKLARERDSVAKVA